MPKAKKRKKKQPKVLTGLAGQMAIMRAICLAIEGAKKETK
jgi:hypothetical protein